MELNLLRFALNNPILQLPAFLVLSDDLIKQRIYMAESLKNIIMTASHKRKQITEKNEKKNLKDNGKGEE